MKVAIVGYGKMGRMIESLAPHYGVAVSHRLDIGWTEAELAPRPDAAIEFSTPEAAVENLERLAALQIPVVCGTTGWFARLDHVRAAFEKHQTALVYSANYSIGVNVFQRLAAEAAALLKDETMYEAWAWEIHHSAKKDAPSGTALALGRAVAGALNRNLDDVGIHGRKGISGERSKKEIALLSVRAGDIVGEHTVIFGGIGERLEFIHRAHSRDTFAKGAIRAAQWLAGQNPGLYGMQDVLGL